MACTEQHAKSNALGTDPAWRQALCISDNFHLKHHDQDAGYPYNVARSQGTDHRCKGSMTHVYSSTYPG